MAACYVVLEVVIYGVLQFVLVSCPKASVLTIDISCTVHHFDRDPLAMLENMHAVWEMSHCFEQIVCGRYWTARMLIVAVSYSYSHRV